MNVALVMFSVPFVCVSVCLSVCNMTVESTDVDSSLSSSSPEDLGQIRILRSSGQGQGHRSKSVLLYPDHGLFAFD